MTFSDLPSNWPDLPVEGPHTADLLDLMVPMRDRLDGVVLVLLCDDERRPVQPVLIQDEQDDRTSPQMMRQALRNFADHLHTSDIPCSSVLVARGREGSLTPTVADTQFALGVLAAFEDRVQVLGVHLVTPRGSRRLDQGVTARRTA